MSACILDVALLSLCTVLLGNGICVNDVELVAALHACSTRRGVADMLYKCLPCVETDNIAAVVHA
jgi:hypothetical protein